VVIVSTVDSEKYKSMMFKKHFLRVEAIEGPTRDLKLIVILLEIIVLV